jgi:hypothetical protein
VYYTPARYSDFYWVSSAGAQHSRNLAERPETEIVIFDSTAPAGQGEAVYITATAGDLRGGALQLYVARTRSCEVHVAANYPVHGRGVDTRQQADPTSTS